MSVLAVQLYLSFSYRDVSINSHFLEHFLDEDVPLHADQKTDVWCVPKLERSLKETDGFVSIIPCRPTDQDPAAFSAYIQQEVDLARRARVPRLLFVDAAVHKRYRLRFPEDAIVFAPDSLAEQSATHRAAIRSFRETLEHTRRAQPQFKQRHAAVMTGRDKESARLAPDLSEILRREGFSVTQLSDRSSTGGVPGIELLEAVWRSELCVFALGERVSTAHLALAAAYSHCVPAFRLQFDRESDDCSPSVNGLMRWRSNDDMLTEFSEQLANYSKGFVRVDQVARGSGAALTMQRLATSEWRKRADSYWNVGDINALLHHIRPEVSFIIDQVERSRRQRRNEGETAEGNPGALAMCRFLYDSVKRLGFVYGLERPISWQDVQAIRTAAQIESHRTATCIDVACLFAAMLEGAHQNALVIIIDGPDFAHALAGYRAPGEPGWERASLGDLRRAVESGDAVIFEATGALISDTPVGKETWEERCDTKTLIFSDATMAGKRMLYTEGVQLRGVLDVAMRRGSGVPPT